MGNPLWDIGRTVFLSVPLILVRKELVWALLSPFFSIDLFGRIPPFLFLSLSLSLLFTFTGNIFSAVIVGYCTMRTDDWTCMPKDDLNDGILRYGLVSVECCISGDFYQVWNAFLMKLDGDTLSINFCIFQAYFFFFDRIFRISFKWTMWKWVVIVVQRAYTTRRLPSLAMSSVSFSHTSATWKLIRYDGENIYILSWRQGN